MPNEILNDILIRLAGKTIQKINSEPMRIDGSGPCIIIIEFMDGTTCHFDTEEFQASFPDYSQCHWWSKDRFEIHKQVMENIR